MNFSSGLANYTDGTMHLLESTNTSENISYYSENGPSADDIALLDSLNPTNSSAYMTASMLRNITVPFICVFGGFGNTAAVVTLLYRRLRHTSCNIYLAVRSMSDTLFLLTLMAVWFDSVGVPFFHKNGICQTVVFTSYVTSFLSVWSVAAITFENYIRVCHPTKLKRFCTLYRAKRVVIILLAVAVVIYQSSLWITEVVEVGPGISQCMTKSKYEFLYIILAHLDTILTLIIPLVVILFFSVCIIYSVVHSYRRRIRLRKAMGSRERTFSFSSTPQAKVTRLLFAVSMIFLILHTPIHIIKLIMIVKIYILKSALVDPIDAALKTVFENMYYLNFSANFVVFFICGETFRRVFWQLFCRCFLSKDVVVRNVEQQTDLTLLNSSRKETRFNSAETLKESESSTVIANIYRNNLCIESSNSLLSSSVPKCLND